MKKILLGLLLALSIIGLSQYPNKVLTNTQFVHKVLVSDSIQSPLYKQGMDTLATKAFSRLHKLSNDSVAPSGYFTNYKAGFKLNASDTLSLNSNLNAKVDTVKISQTALNVTTNGNLKLNGYISSLEPAGYNWTAQTSPTGTWQSVTYGNGLFVVVSYDGSVMTSPDGINWTSRTALAGNWYSVTYGNGIFVVVGTNSVRTSPDGINWTSRTAPAGNWQSVTYGNGLFVVVSYQGSVMTSPDGINWTSRTAPAGYFQSVTYGNGLFVAVGNGSPFVMTSPDGVTWTVRTAPTVAWQSVTYGNGLFVVVSYDGSVMTSPDGVTWTSQTALAGYWYSVTYGNGLFVAVGVSPYVMTSPDGVTWTVRTAPAPTGDWQSVTYGNGLFVAVSYQSPSVMTSSPTTLITRSEFTIDTLGNVTAHHYSTPTDSVVMWKDYINHSDTVAANYKLKADTVLNEGYKTNWKASQDTVKGRSYSNAIYKLNSDSVNGSGYFTNYKALAKANKSDTTVYLETKHQAAVTYQPLGSYQPSGTYLIPLDSTHIRSYSNAIYKLKSDSTGLKGFTTRWTTANDTVLFRTASNNKYLKLTGGTLTGGLTGTTITQQSTVAQESASLGSELTTSAGWTFDATWTGSYDNFTHISGTGNTTSLNNTLAAVTNNLYQITYTITGRTTGSITINYGGVSIVGITATGNSGPKAVSTATLSIVPTFDFNGTVSISIKVIGSYNPVFTINNSTGSPYLEIRSSTNGLNNQFIGFRAGYSNTTGGGNNFNGVQAGYSNTTGSGNNFNGYQAGYSNTTGGSNNFNGVRAGYSNTTGIGNNFNGYQAGYSNTTGNYNNFNGYQAGSSNTTGIGNNFNGYQAGYSNTTGGGNNFNGYYAGFSNTTGGSNNFNGGQAGHYIADGVTSLTNASYSTFDGASTKALADNGTNETVIGYNTTGHGSNTVTIGNTSVTNSYIQGTNNISHIKGSTASPTIVAGAAAGTSPTVSMATNSTDLAGSFTVTLGTSPSTGVLATITFNTPYSTTPFVTITPTNANAASTITNIYITSTTTTFVINATATVTMPSVAYTYNYTVIQ